MVRIVIRITLIAVVVLGFLLFWASIAFNWPAAQLIVPGGYVLLAIGFVVGLIRRRQPRHAVAELSASDAYSDLQLGRRPPTHFPRDEASTSQIGDPPSDR